MKSSHLSRICCPFLPESDSPLSLVLNPPFTTAVAFQLVKPNYYAIATRAGLTNGVARTVLKARRDCARFLAT